MAEAGRDLLARALDRRAAGGQPVFLWLRDDDATGDRPALRRLIELAGAHGIAPVIAAIPGLARDDLLAALDGNAARVAVHGASHVNHALPGARKSELGGERPTDAMLAELACARRRLARLCGARLLPTLVPPWNRIAAELVPRLGEAGFTSLSVFGPVSRAPSAPGMRVVNTHIDIIDWRAGRTGRPADALFRELAHAALAPPDRDPGQPLGILTHHLDHDRACWRFLEDLFALAAGHPGARWLAPGDLMRDDRAHGPAGAIVAS
jgi:hypothetical protein